MAKVSTAPHSHTEVQQFFQEALAKDAKLIDKGLPGIVDEKDQLVYTNAKGKAVKSALGKKRVQLASLQLNIAKAARAFHAAQVTFSDSSAKDAVNKDFWWMGFGGKMGLRAGVKPSAAIQDVFSNGKKYGMECATALMIVLYKGVLDTLGPADFDREFDKIRLFRWSIKDDDFLQAEQLGKLPGHWPGDHAYFKNPDFDPKDSSTQGENTIYLGGGEYFGHGIGIVDEKKLISELNQWRRPGATRSAYRDDFELRLNPKKVFELDRLAG